MRTQTALPPVDKEVRNGKGELALTVSHQIALSVLIDSYYSTEMLKLQVFYNLCSNHASTSPKTCARSGSLKTS